MLQNLEKIVPVSKKRVKKKDQRKSAGPPPPKSQATPKKSLSRQQIAIYVISALIILSMAVGFIVSGMGGGGTAPIEPDVSQEIQQPAPDNAEDTEASTDAPASEVEDTSADQ